MKLRTIDTIIKTIEIKADEVGYAIDRNPDYCQVCQIITDFDYDGIVPTFEQKVFCAETLEMLCKGLGINYHALIIKAWED